MQLSRVYAGKLKVKTSPLLGWFGVGLVIRFLLMPFAVNPDLLAVYWRAHLIAYDGRLFGEYLVNMGAHYAHAAWLALASPLLPPPDVVWKDPWFFANWGALAPQVTRWFSTQPWTYQTLFVLKVPYLLADLGAGLLLLALASRADPRLVRRAWVFWMLSPIGLYASYMFGRYEMFPVVLVVAALLACERGRPWLGALLLGMAITMRTYPLLLIPVFGLIVAPRPASWGAAWGAVALAPLGLVMGANKLFAGSAGELGRLKDFETGSTLFSYAVPVEGSGDFYLFVLFALVLYGILLGRALGWWGSPVPLEQLWIWLLLFHAGFFAFSTFAARYFTWFTPFVFLALARRPAWRGTLPLHLLQCVAVLALADLVHGGPVILLGLFEPMHPDLATAWPNLQEAFLTSPELGSQVAGVLATAFTALSVLFVVPALVELTRPVPTAPPPEQGFLGTCAPKSLFGAQSR